MKKTLVLAAAVAALTFAPARAAEGDKPQKALKVLMIGNSFSICNLKQMPPVAEAMGCKVDLVSLYIGGCSLERHWNNVVAASTNEAFRPYKVTWRYASLADQSKVPFAAALGEGLDWQKNPERRGNIPAMLAGDTWDVVTIQQASHFSWDSSTYHPYGDNLVAKIRELAPQAKIVVQETWSYPPWDRRLKKFGFDQVEMYARIHDAYASFAAKYGFDVIPVGTAAEFVPARETLFSRPDFHFNRDGEYLQGLAFTATLFGADVRACPYRPAWMDSKRAEEIKNAVMDAVEGTRRVRRAFRDARHARGSTNVIRLQPIDAASWVWLPDAKEPTIGTTDFWAGERNGDIADAGLTILKFRRAFDVAEGDGTLVFDVSADERFYLTLDGEFVARGPNRGTVENWQYQTYVATGLKPGRHVFEAYVQRLGDFAPLAQLSHRGGFVFKANGAYDAKLTTGRAAWDVGAIAGVRAIGKDKDAQAWGTGSQFEITGCGPYSGEPDAWTTAKVVRGPAGSESVRNWGGRTGGWMLFPSQIPDQTERRVVPGKVKAVSSDAPFRSCHVFTGEEATRTLDVTRPFTVPANTKMQFAWDLGDYYCAYPEVRLSGGKGARVAVCFSEAARRGDTHRKTGETDSRGQIAGRYLAAFGDTFVSDGRDGAVFSAPWFRCGKWCRVDVETKDEPLTVDALALVESRYPVELESAFLSPDDPSLGGVRRICARAMQMCCHEMLFDCPFYEQQMYPGDTRVQLNVLSAMSRDDRIIKRAIEIYDLNTRDDGQCPFNFPTRGVQEGASYTLCYLLMYGDYAMGHADRDWLRARLPGLRKSMAGMECYENAEGLLENLPGWNFMDWVVGWDGDGTAPGCRAGDGVNAELNLYWNLAMLSAARTERALGNELQAQYWEEKSRKLKAKIVETFWSDERGLLADTPKKRDFSEHAQALALIGDVFASDEAARGVFGRLVDDPDLKRCTVYFSYYLFEAYFKFGRGDLFLKRLDLWRDYVRKGLATTQEAPDSGKNGQNESRSDCHAWGAHPIWFMQTGLAGIRPDAPFFGRVRIAPCPGGLKSIKATHPHPKGWIAVTLSFDGEKASGTIETPVPGTFVYGGRTVELVEGLNIL
ncbi:MAG: DUF4886 domain-containing protein [Kiritimatiellae bacterium]|nr:DUF4886 domain-containing protein [Kiritimatiellia bacterium]